MNSINKFLSEFDGKGKVFSALLSVLTLFAVLGQVAPKWYQQMPVYSEWICGVTTWSGYPKQADMHIIQCALLGLPLLFLLFGVIYVVWNRVMGRQGRKAGTVFVISYLAVLGMFFMGQEYAPLWFCLWTVLWLGYVALGLRGRAEQFAGLVESVTLVMLVLYAVMLCLNGFFPSVGSVWHRLAVGVPVAGGILFLLLGIIGMSREKARLLSRIQLLLPLAWLGFVHFRYRYEKDGSLIELFYSGRWKWACVACCLFFLICAVVEQCKTKHTLLFSTFVMTAVMRVFSQPEGMLNIDYFHNGEITMPMQQLVSYGKLPYVDIIPIHGMCDYYYGVVNYLFFDGTYMSLNAAKVAGDLLMAVLLAGAIYFFIENKRQAFFGIYLFMPFMIQGAGMRYWLLFLLFFVLFSERMRKGMQSLYAWILLSVLAIAWNASIGGAAALAFLPVIAYRFFRDVRTQWRELCCSRDKVRRNVTWIAWAALFLTGVAFVPMFLKIVGYLRENTGTTLYVNGMEMLENLNEVSGYFVPGLLNAHGSFWIVTFAFLIPLLLSFALMFQKERYGAGEVFVTYLLAFWVLVNYAFVRYDEGLRTGVLGVFFLFFTAVTLLWRVRKCEDAKNVGLTGLYTFVFALAVVMAKDAPVMTAETLVLERKIPASVETVIMGQEIEDPVVHVSGELVAMPNLGTGFIQGNTLASLQNVNAVVRAAEADGKTILDLTNAVANAVLLDMPLYLPYSSAYNISNTVMQEKAIAILEERLPDIILAAPEIRFDDAPFSYRSGKLYRYLMGQAYVPYKYENVIYLVRGENPLPDAKADREAFAQLMHKKDLAYLPAVWGSSIDTVEGTLTELPIKAETVATENGYEVVFEQAVPGSKLGMIGISGLRSVEKEEEVRVQVNVKSALAADGTVPFEFALKGERYLIPVGTSPYIIWEEEIVSVEITSDAWEKISAEKMEVFLYQ